ncbi:MAG: hypothetical protein IT313_07310 [Anaerolineales bacterium]|nr:hypothetical protein [Anaerolineales bacterium]
MKLSSQIIWLSLTIILGIEISFPFPLIAGNIDLAWLRIFSTFILYFFIVTSALGIGIKLIGQYNELSALEKFPLSLILGFAVISNGILILGLIGQLNPIAIYAWGAICGFIASFEWQKIIPILWDKTSSLKQNYFTKFQGIERTLLSICGLCLVLTIVMALTPIRDYDALMYHLEIPQLLLGQGKYFFDPEFYRLSYPALTEMLFMIGIAFRLDIFAQWISLTYCVIFFISVYAYGRRFFNSSVGVLAVCILAGNPAFPIYAASPSNDYSWASYDFWCLFALSIWLSGRKQDRQRKFLFLAAILAGLAASTKYLALPFVGITGFLVATQTIKNGNGIGKEFLRNISIFGLTALVVASLWYLKNLVWTGNPFYPLIFGGPGWDTLQQNLFNDYMGSFGAGGTLKAYLMTPINVYLEQSRFATLSLEIVHPVLWLGFAIILTKEWKKHDLVVIYSIVGFVFWSVGMNVIRFLLPLSGCLALLSSQVISTFPRTLKHFISTIFIGGFMVITLIYQINEIRSADTLSYLIGKISASEFLEKNVYDYKTTEFILETLSDSDRVLYLWSGQGYYCNSRCLPDDEQSIAIRLSMNSPIPETLAYQLRSKGITHILLGRPDAYWFISLHDPRHLHRKALDYFENVFLPTCGKSIYQDNLIELYQLTCP